MRQTQPPPLRTGPRPLPLHLATATNGWISSRAGLPLLRNASTNWRPEVAKKVAELKAALGPGLQLENREHPDSADPFAAAVDREIHARLTAFSDGIQSYRDHPYQRELAEPPVIWSDGATRLLDYGPEDGTPVLFIPSLINRAYILDLSERRSLLRWMAAETGLRPLLVDWGVPGDAERKFSLTDYIAGPLTGALAHTRSLSDRAVPVVGYCMGGLLALALAALKPGDVTGLVLMATPLELPRGTDCPGRSTRPRRGSWQPASRCLWGAAGRHHPIPVFSPRPVPRDPKVHRLRPNRPCKRGGRGLRRAGRLAQ